MEYIARKVGEESVTGREDGGKGIKKRKGGRRKRIRQQNRQG
jgi:hypothetical protein